MKTIRGKIYLPLILIELYLMFSYLLYRYGCYIWSFRDDNRTLIFILLVAILFGTGYIFAVRLQKRSHRMESGKHKLAMLPCSKVLIVCCIIAVVIFIPICISYTNSWYPPVWKTLTDPKGVYYELAEIAKNRSGIRFLGFLDVIPYMILPLTLYKWEEISSKLKAVSMILAFGYLAIYISSGRNISVAIQMISVVGVWLSVVCNVDKGGNYKKAVIRTTILAILYCIVAVSFFGLTMSSRLGFTKEVAENLDHTSIADHESGANTGKGANKSESTVNKHKNEHVKDNEEEDDFVDEFAKAAETWDSETMGQSLGIGTYEYNGLEITKEQLKNFNTVHKVFPNYTDIWSKSYVNIEDPIVRSLPSVLKNLYVIGCSYVSNGYNCLTVALHTEHQWTYGVGHSAFLSSYADAFLGTEISERTYYSRLTNDKEYPLVSKSLWPSYFVQMADDLTFAGVIIFMGLAGFVVANVWVSIIKLQNYWGVLLLGQLILWALFLPANNILENSGGFFVTFWLLFFAWTASWFRLKMKHHNSVE